MQDLQIQLDALMELRSFLIQYNEEMRAKSVEFNSKFWSIRESGLPSQFADNFEANYADPTLQNLRNMIAGITDRDIPYVNSLIAQFEQALAIARM